MGHNKRHSDEITQLDINGPVPPYLASFAHFHLIQNGVFDFQTLLTNDIPLDEVSALKVSTVIDNQNWTTYPEEDRNLSHLLMCEMVLPTIENSRFDVFLDGINCPNLDNASCSLEGYFLKSVHYIFITLMYWFHSGESTEYTQSDVFAPSEKITEGKSVRSESNQPGFEEHDSELGRIIGVDDPKFGSRDRAFTFLHVNPKESAPVKSSRKPVSESVMRVSPIVCPANLAKRALKSCSPSKLELPLASTLGDLDITLFAQNEVSWVCRSFSHPFVLVSFVSVELIGNRRSSFLGPYNWK